MEYEVYLYDLIMHYFGSLPPELDWVIGASVLILFTFICSFVLDLLCNFFGMFFIGGGRRG